MCKRHKRFVIFLDVDGVLNTTTTVQKTPDGYTGIDDARVEVLAKTIEKIRWSRSCFVFRLERSETDR
mgnify:CR=1 FL=1